MVSWIELGNISTVVFSQDLKKKKCLEKKKSNLSFSKPVSAVLLWCSALKTVCHQKHLPMGWSCAYFYAETLFSPKVASKLLFQISTDHKANMALLRLRKTDSAKERGRFRSALFFQNTTGPSHRNSMPPKCTESKKNNLKTWGNRRAASSLEMILKLLTETNGTALLSFSLDYVEQLFLLVVVLVGFFFSLLFFFWKEGGR